MKKFISRLIVSLGLVASALTPALVPAVVSAAPVDVFQSCNSSAGLASDICKNQSNQKLFGPGSFWNRVINVFIYLIGALSVLMIVVGGFRYVVSGGDSSAVNGAKNTILYAIVGIVVALSAYGIVNFVVTRI